MAVKEEINNHDNRPVGRYHLYPVLAYVQLRLVYIEKDEPSRAERAHLGYDLHPDRAPRPRHQHRFPLDEFPDAPKIHGDNLAADEILDADVFEPLEVDVRPVEIVDPRHHLDDADLELPRRIVQLAQGFVAQRRDGDNDGLHPLSYDDLPHLPQIAQHPHAVHLHSGLGPVVIQKPDGVESRESIARHVPHEHLPGISPTDDQRPLPLAPCPLLPDDLQIELLGDSQGGDKRQREKPVHEEDALAQPRDRQMKVRIGQAQNQKRHLGDDHGQHNVQQIGHAHVPPGDFVNAKNHQNTDLHDHKKKQNLPKELCVGNLKIKIKVNKEGEVKREGDDKDVVKTEKKKPRQRRRVG